MKAREQRRDALDQIEARAGRDMAGGMAAGTAVKEQHIGNVAKLADAANIGAAPAPQTRQVDLAEQQLEQNRIVARMRNGANADTFRILRTKVMQLLNRNNLRSIAITSPRYS